MSRRTALTFVPSTWVGSELRSGSARRVVIAAFPGVELLDVAGPAEMSVAGLSVGFLGRLFGR